MLNFVNSSGNVVFRVSVHSEVQLNDPTYERDRANNVAANPPHNTVALNPHPAPDDDPDGYIVVVIGQSGASIACIGRVPDGSMVTLTAQNRLV